MKRKDWGVYEGVAAPAVIVKGKPGRPERIIAICRLEMGSEGYSEALANAHLIAASPRMLEFIRHLADNGNQEARDFMHTLGL